MDHNVREVTAKTILQKSGLPDADWVVNPYTGCRFGCKYCYAAFVGRFTHPNEPWGSYVDVKINAPELLRKELSAKLKNVEVGMTVTSTGDAISKYLETFASPHEVRLETLKKLHDEGIATYAFVGPLLPHFVFQKENLEALLRAIKRTGVRYIYLEHINLSPTIADRLFHDLRKDHPALVKQFQAARSPEYRRELDQLLANLTKTIDLPVAHQQAIYHHDTKSWKTLKK